MRTDSSISTACLVVIICGERGDYRSIVVAVVQCCHPILPGCTNDMSLFCVPVFASTCTPKITCNLCGGMFIDEGERGRAEEKEKEKESECERKTGAVGKGMFM